MTPKREIVTWCIINIAPIIVWTFHLCQVGFPGIYTLLNHTDAPQYTAVGDWLFGGVYTSYVSTRTYLFPLFLILVKKLFGLQSFFIVQSLLWLGSVNFIYASIHRILKQPMLAAGFSLIFILNLSILSMTYEVLTETVTIFFCSLLIWIITGINSFRDVQIKSGVILLIVSVLTLMKPIFEPLFVLFLLATVFLFFRKPEIRTRKNISWCVAAILLIGVQLFISVKYTGTFSISGVGNLTVRGYLIAQTYCHSHFDQIMEARRVVWQMSLGELMQFCIANFPELMRNYIHHLHFNISSYPSEASAINSPRFELEFMVWWNKFHWLAQLALPVLLIFSAKKIFRDESLRWKSILLALFMYEIVLVIGVSYGQGDRLVLPAIPFAFALYAIILKVFFLKRQNSIQKFTAP